MSIFPKRTCRNGSVTIHCNVDLSAVRSTHVTPILTLKITDPAGTEVATFEQLVLDLPAERHQAPFEVPKSGTYLRRDVPLMILASYLGGEDQREKLVELLASMPSGRHFYFSFQVPADALLGKYTASLVVHLNGRTRHSATAPGDHFFVEHLVVRRANGDKITIENEGPEPVPAKTALLSLTDTARAATVEIFDVPAHTSVTLTMAERHGYLYYNEERVAIPINGTGSPYLIRDQRVLTMTREGRTYLLRRDQEEAFELSGTAGQLWSRASSLLQVDQLGGQEIEALEDLKGAGLIRELPVAGTAT